MTLVRTRSERPDPNPAKAAIMPVVVTQNQRSLFWMNSAVIPYTEARNKPRVNPARLRFT